MSTPEEKAMGGKKPEGKKEPERGFVHNAKVRANNKWVREELKRRGIKPY